MQRSLWHGAISFGLVYLPVDLFSAARENTLSMHLLDKRDFAPVGYHHINKHTGKEVDWKDIVKGYEYKKGQYVALSDADFKHANAKASETIAITAFVAADDIPPIYFDSPYYLAPRKGGDKAFALLGQVLQATRKVALAGFVMRGRQHRCMIVPNDGTLMLLTLRFEDEILSPVKSFTRSAASKSSAVSAAELAMAKQLVQGMSGSFKPSQLKDTYRADLLRRIKQKIKQKQTHSLEVEETTAPERPTAQVIDLMEALKSSLKKGKTSHGANHTKNRQRRRA